ncbi:hypothetical protein TNCV_5061931 [Trichonephila clavipes]|nr:hypothetical protein TNCV_5061931 [Trichonephila clavipes]
MSVLGIIFKKKATFKTFISLIRTRSAEKNPSGCHSEWTGQESQMNSEGMHFDRINMDAYFRNSSTTFILFYLSFLSSIRPHQANFHIGDAPSHVPSASPFSTVMKAIFYTPTSNMTFFSHGQHVFLRLQEQFQWRGSHIHAPECSIICQRGG